MAVPTTPQVSPKPRVVPKSRAAGSQQLASIGLRCSAFLLDYILTMLVPSLTVLLAVYFKRRWNAPGLANIVLIVGYVLTLGLVVFNWVYLSERDGQSFGKRFIGIRIVREDGARISYRTAILRHLVGYPLSIFPFALGICWALLGRKQQAWHDKLAGTLVVKD